MAGLNFSTTTIINKIDSKATEVAAKGILRLGRGVDLKSEYVQTVRKSVGHDYAPCVATISLAGLEGDYRLDVTLGTVRTVQAVKGRTLVAGLIAFFEVVIWFLIVREALQSEASIWVVIAYSGGYATGTMLGTLISQKCINSIISVEVITSKATPESIDLIRRRGYGISVFETVNNLSEPKHMLLITLNSKNLKDLKKILYDIDPKAFVVVDELKVVHNGYIK